MNRNHALLIYSGWLGDLVWIIPAIHALRTAFRSVSLVVSEVQAPLAEVLRNGLVTQVYVDHPARRLAGARAVRRAARAAGIDTVIDLKGRWKTGLYMPSGRGLTLRIPHAADAREYALSRLLHPRAARMPARTGGHMVDAYLSGLRELGLHNAPVSFDLPFSASVIEAGEQIVRREGLRAPRTVALHPGSAQFSKIWPAANYRRLAEILQHDLHCKVVLMGAQDFAPNDNYDLRTARESFRGSGITSLVEETPLAVDAYLLSTGAFAVSVGNDSFAGHMAGSAHETDRETPGAVQAGNGRWYKAHHTLSLFGPTNPVFCRPYDPTGAFNTVVLPASYPAACVYDRRSHTCPHYGDRYCVDRAHCMQHLTLDQVVSAVEDKFRQQETGEHGKWRHPST